MDWNDRQMDQFIYTFIFSTVLKQLIFTHVQLNTLLIIIVKIIYIFKKLFKTSKKNRIYKYFIIHSINVDHTV